MFYIGHFLKIFKIRPKVMTSFVLANLLLLFFMGNFRMVSSNLKDLFGNHPKDSFFKAMINKKTSFQSTARKLRNLPGVKKVIVNDKVKVPVEQLQFLSEYDKGLAKEVGGTQYASLKVVFEPELKNRSKLLIKKYLKRLVSEKNLTVGPIKNGGVVKNSENSLLQYLGFIAGVALVLFWIGMFSLFKRELIKSSYIIENFQRRKFVAVKSFILGEVFLLSIMLSFSVVLLNITFFDTVLAFVGMLIITTPFILKPNWKV